MKLIIPKLKSITFITFCFNFASPTPFYEVDKYIEDFEFVTDDVSVPKDTATEKAFIWDYFESPRRNLQKNNDEEFEAIQKEYLKELEEHKANELNKIHQIAEETNKANVFRKSQGRANDRFGSLNRICGADTTDTLGVVDGPANIESFPWLGVLIYPKGKVRLITTVILVTRNTVIGSALDIERLPKLDFRKNSKVILGQTCKHPGIKVLDYNYHPDYGKETYSSIVLIQIDLASVSQVLWPICGPPKVLMASKFYTITLPNDCRKSKVEIFSMDFVKPEVCKHYYKRTGLDLGSIWPNHGACGRARTQDECVWRNGVALVVKQSGRWHLMGIGVNGPGCAAPSRYVDYGAYSGWVAHSVARIGRPALTRLADNHLILRRSVDKIQRYGPCDANELRTELFCDRTNATADREYGKARYNLTLIEKYDYTCIALKANSRYKLPKISLKGVCDSPHPICYVAKRFVLDFYIDITFSREVWFKICVYGKLVAVPDAKGALKYFNKKKTPVPIPWGLSTPTTVDPKDNNPSDYTGDKFSNLTIEVSNSNSLSTKPSVNNGNGSSSLPAMGKGIDSFITPPDYTYDELTTLIPAMDKGNDSSSIIPPDHTDGNESSILTIVVPQDNYYSFITPTDYTGDDFSTLTTEVPKDNKLSYLAPPAPTDEFWTLTPTAPKDNDFSSITPTDYTGDDFLTLTTLVPAENEPVYAKPPESNNEFWTLIPTAPKDNDSSSTITLTDYTGDDFSTLTTVVPKENKSSYLAPPVSTKEFKNLTPTAPKDNEFSFIIPTD